MAFNREDKKRNRLEIMDNILSLTEGRGIKKTHIMYQANLSYMELEKYLDRLIGKQLLAERDGYYTTTKLGLEYLEKFKEIQSLMA